MQLGSKQDINAPIEFVFARISDFPEFQRRALRRGARIERVDSLTEPAPGVCWKAAFAYRGKERDVEARLAEFERPERMLITYESAGFSGSFAVDLIALNKGRTRMAIKIIGKPKTLATRLFTQSLRLARASLQKRVSKRLQEYAASIEADHRDTA